MMLLRPADASSAGRARNNGDPRDPDTAAEVTNGHTHSACASTAPPPETAEEPSVECSPSGAQPRAQSPDDTGARVAAAVVALKSRSDRDTSGRFTRGNLVNLRHGGRSLQLVGALEDAKRELLAQVRSDLALDETAAATLSSLADAFAESSLLRRSMFQRMAAEGGPTSGRGRTRAAFNAYLSVLDRELRLAQALGLERRQRPVHPMDALRSAVASAPDHSPPPSPTGDVPA